MLYQTSKIIKKNPLLTLLKSKSEELNDDDSEVISKK